MNGLAVCSSYQVILFGEVALCSGADTFTWFPGIEDTRPLHLLRFHRLCEGWLQSPRPAASHYKYCCIFKTNNDPFLTR